MQFQIMKKFTIRKVFNICCSHVIYTLMRRKKKSVSVAKMVKTLFQLIQRYRREVSSQIYLLYFIDIFFLPKKWAGRIYLLPCCFLYTYILLSCNKAVCDKFTNSLGIIGNEMCTSVKHIIVIEFQLQITIKNGLNPEEILKLL